VGKIKGGLLSMKNEIYTMDTLKVNISFPVGMYKEAKVLIDKGLYGSFSEMVRSGIRNEIDMQRELNPEFVTSIRAAEASGYKKYKSGREMIADLHKAAEKEV
jgi:Arc/MetJ-type ribon-helix-helix transcriptional regulator